MPVIVLSLIIWFFLDNSTNNEDSFADFGDLGTMLLGGFGLAVAVAIAFTFVRLRLREKKPPPAQFISISSFDKKRSSTDYADYTD